ncbi:chloride channel protein [Acidithiobacillus sp. CV18-2]|uniref:Chloride channel protein n=1 Tax=Igneacidithiobacillus copahuensis TaxID=2724909 RepID=A0AAE2YRR7_9PROT|nr:chloride channel protein [Igneacidithiobacillus copahuensis]MBU2753388.1 chloride channel protein [Acidithiobacillus sp. CV18-3]MBU2756418.1 chloride channel protein [Acidithiobacillus sp. BN09-2]MBU2776205.1 chloride channel protein [Acidithiobacillus sp. CV18-2]MBU2795667.1 chloride channel protein [Acidithiobacillus sp. VAN18-2]MBU2798333.1 chloride channel protein [Acidithiobacillus sp. VAN18-4]UTV81704.1 chloride channel protein [Acidithiobacillus sp. YTS05]
MVEEKKSEWHFWHPEHGAFGEGPLLALLGAIIGVLTGLGNIVFHYLVAVIHNVAILNIFDFHDRAHVHTPPSPWGWALPLVPTLGGLLVIFLARKYGAAVQGAGVSQVIEAAYTREGRMARSIALLRPLATAITVGTGGSAGREGPAMQFGAAITAWLDAIFTMPAHRRIHLLGCGVGAGIAAVFNAPLGGWFLAMEIIVPDWRPWTILSTLIATIGASQITELVFGNFHLLPAVTSTLVNKAADLPLFVILGAINALAAILFIAALTAITQYSEIFLRNPYLRHALGMFLVGLLLLLCFAMTGHYYLIGGSYAGIGDILRGEISAWGILLLLLLLKLLATSLTIGSGGSGGIFSPSLFIGAGTGALYGLLLLHWQILPAKLIGLLALCGMAGMVAASTGALLSAPVMAVELTGSYEALLPAMLTSVSAFAIRRMLLGASIYTLPLRRHGLDVPENHYVVEGPGKQEKG